MRSSASLRRGGGTGAPPRLAVLAPRAPRRLWRPPDGRTRARELRARLGGAPVPPRTAMLAGVLVVPIFLSAAIAATGRISVPADVTAVGAVVRLGDVALLDGAAAAFGDVSLGAAPAAGESRNREGARVLGAVRRAGAALSEVTYTIQATIRVRRASQDGSEG